MLRVNPWYSQDQTNMLLEFPKDPPSEAAMPLLHVVQDGCLLCIQHQCYTIDKLVPSFHFLLMLSNYKFQLALLYHHQFHFLGVV